MNVFIGVTVMLASIAITIGLVFLAVNVCMHRLWWGWVKTARGGNARTILRLMQNDPSAWNLDSSILTHERYKLRVDPDPYDDSAGWIRGQNLSAPLSWRDRWAIYNAAKPLYEGRRKAHELSTAVEVLTHITNLRSAPEIRCDGGTVYLTIKTQDGHTKTFEDKADQFPSDTLITQVMLVA